MKRLLLFAGLWLGVTASATDIVWTNLAGGNWNTAANWNPNQVPGSADNAFITNNGTYIVTLNANATNNTLTLGGTSGTQTFNQASFTLTLNGGGSGSTHGVYNLSGGTLTGSGTLALAGPFHWSAGNLGNAGTSLGVTVNDGLTLSGSTKFLNSGSLVNSGAGTWSGGQIQCSSAVFSNAPGATLDFQGDGSAFLPNTGNPLFANAGTLRKSAGTGTTTISVPFNNSGLVQAQVGVLALTGGGTSSGQFTNSSGATLTFGGGTHTLLAASTVAGAGSVSVSGGATTVNVAGGFSAGAVTNGAALNFNAAATAYATNFSLSGGTLAGTGALVLAGPFTWTAGTVGASLVVWANGGLTLGGSTKFLAGGTVVNGGAATWNLGQIQCSGSAVFSNAPGATFDFLGDGSAFFILNGTPWFVNAGTLRKTAGTGVTTCTLPCRNSGAVQVSSGVLALAVTDSTGSFAPAAGGTLSVSGDAILSPTASITGAGNFTVMNGVITNQGLFSTTGTNTFNSGAATLEGNCAVTGAVVVNGGMVRFNGTGTVAPVSLNFSEGILVGNMPLNVSGQFTWTGGTFGSADSSLLVAATGGLTLSGSTKFFSGGTLVNGGTGAWTGGQIQCSGGTVFSNTPGATFDFQADGAAFVLAGGSPVLGNAGTFRKTAGTGTTTISLPCHNFNSVQVQTGTLALAGGGTSSGQFTSSNGATLNFSSGTHTLSGSSTLSGPGSVLVNGGTVNVNGTVAVGALTNSATLNFNAVGTAYTTNLTLSGGTLSGSGTLAIPGPFNWTGGTLGGAGTSLAVFANGGMAIGGSTKFLAGGILVNGAAATWNQGQVQCSGSAVFSNAPGATFDFPGDGTPLIPTGGSPLFFNAGTLRKAAGASTTISMPCNNSGLVQASSGLLNLTLTNSTGNFAAAAGATLSVNGTATLSAAASFSGPGNFTVTGGAITNNGSFNTSGTNSFSGGIASLNGNCQLTGTLAVNNGTVLLNGTGTIAPAALNFSGGSLLGNMPVTVSGLFAWTGGTLGSAGSSLVVTANGGLTFSGSAKAFDGGTLINAGAGLWSGGQVVCGNTAGFSNTPAASLDFQADGVAFVGTPAFANAGTLRKAAGAGTTTINVPCNNSGLVQSDTGTLNFTTAFIQNGGQTLLNGGNFAFAQTAQLRGGALAGSGTVTGSVSNNATVSPGASPGRLTITGNYTESANARLQIELGGTTPATGYDQLSVGGTATLAGTLVVSYWNGFVPGPGNVFTSVVCNVRSGGFTAIQAPTNNLGTIYTAKAVLLETGNASPTAQLNVNPVQIACHTVLLQAAASDPDGTVTNLTVLQGTNILGSFVTPTAQVLASYDFPGDVTFTALATDNKGASGATNVVVTFVTLPEGMLDAVGFQTNRAFKLCMEALAGKTNRVEASDNLSLTNWTDLGVMENTNGIWRFSDLTATNSAHRYYRTRQLP